MDTFKGTSPRVQESILVLEVRCQTGLLYEQGVPLLRSGLPEEVAIELPESLFLIIVLRNWMVLPDRARTLHISAIFQHSVGPHCPAAEPSVESLRLPDEK